MCDRSLGRTGFKPGFDNPFATAPCRNSLAFSAFVQVLTTILPPQARCISATLNGSGESRCTSEFNNELKFRLRNETDFMKSIFPGGDRQGKTQRSRRPRKRCVENHRNAALRNNDRTEDQVG
jgi:hypothetical protein